MSWTLAGWSVEASAAVLGLVGVIVTALYVLALRRRPVEVPFVALWSSALDGERSSRLFARLRRIVSWLLALLFVALVTGALADPRAEGSNGSDAVFVIAIDVSASMGAPGRMDAAREAARAVIDTLGATDRAVVIAMGASARPASATTNDHAALRSAIDALTPLDVSADLDATAALAVDVAAGAHAELVVISDGAVAGEAEARARLATASLAARHVRVGDGGPNLAITSLAIRRYPLDAARNEVLLEVTSASDDAEHVEVELRGDDETIDVIPLEVPARGHARRFFADVTGVDRALEARLACDHDVLEADDHAFARVPTRRRVRVVVVSEDDIYLDAALLLDEYLDVRDVAPADFPPSEPFDVAVLDRFVPSAPMTTDAIWIDPPPTAGVAGPLDVRGTIDRPFFDRLRRDHPLLRHASLGDVNVARALDVVPRPGDTVVAGDARGPLLLTGERDGHRFVALTFDLRESDLPLRPAFPLLLLDAIDSFTPTDAAYRGSVRTGEPALVELPVGATRAQIGDTSLPIRAGLASVRFERAGMHTIETDAGEVLVAANLDAAREVDLTPHTLDLGPSPTTVHTAVSESALPWVWLTLAAIALVAIEWATFHRRWTV
jgi:hypothetical protein